MNIWHMQWLGDQNWLGVDNTQVSLDFTIYNIRLISQHCYNRSITFPTRHYFYVYIHPNELQLLLSWESTTYYFQKCWRFEWCTLNHCWRKMQLVHPHHKHSIRIHANWDDTWHILLQNHWPKCGCSYSPMYVSWLVAWWYCHVQNLELNKFSLNGWINLTSSLQCQISVDQSLQQSF